MTEYKVRSCAKSDGVPILKAWVEIISMFTQHMPNLKRRHNYHYICRTIASVENTAYFFYSFHYWQG